MNEGNKKPPLSASPPLRGAQEEAFRQWRMSIEKVKMQSQSGAALRQWRHRRNVSQAALAAAWEVSPRSIIRWEQREVLPVLVRLAIIEAEEK